MTIPTDPVREALAAAIDALPRVGEKEDVYCMVRGHHLRTLAACTERALSHPPAAAEPWKPVPSPAAKPPLGIYVGGERRELSPDRTYTPTLDDLGKGIAWGPVDPSPQPTQPAAVEPREGDLPPRVWLNDNGTAQKLSFSPIDGAFEHFEYVLASAPQQAAPAVQARPLTAAMDNVLAWKLGKIANAAAERTNFGDYIDQGLHLLRFLNEGGFALTQGQQEKKE